MKAVMFDFAESRAGRYAGDFLGDWRGTLVCDDYVAYKALFHQGTTEAGCMAHARRKFHELYVNHQSQIAEKALNLFDVLYNVERQVQGAISMLSERPGSSSARRRPIPYMSDAGTTAARIGRQCDSQSDRSHPWTLGLLTYYLDDEAVPIDSNSIDSKKNGLFAGSLRGSNV